MKTLLRCAAPWVRWSLITALAASSAPAAAALPFALKPRPRVYVSAENIARLKAILAVPIPLTNTQFPATGTLRFALKPKPALADGFGPLFDAWDPNRRHLFIRHNQSAASGSDDCPLQIAFMDDGPAYVAAWNGHLTCEQWHQVSVSWNSTSGTARVVIDSSTSDLTFSRAFAPDGQRFEFHGAGGDQIDELFLSDSDTGGATVAAFALDENQGDLARSADGANRIRLSGAYRWVDRSAGQSAIELGDGAKRGELDILPKNELSTAFATLKAQADRLAAQLIAGDDIYAPEPVESAHPLRFTTSAKHIGLAWLLTGDEKYRTALFVLADQILAASPTGGNDFSRAGRVGALGFMYDWLYADIKSRTHVASAKTYQQAIYDYVRETALKDGVFFCGNSGPFVSEWKCKTPLPATWATGSHADYNNSLFMAAVLAMVDDFPSMEELATVLLHDDQEVVAPFRDYVSIDGAHHFGYDYGATYTQLFGALGWKSATDIDPLRPYMANLPYRIIYGLRSDGLQPAEGDAYRLVLLAEEAALPLMTGTTFFDNQHAQKLFRTRARGAGSSFFELLFWNLDAAESPIEELPLVRHFRVAGSVIARESWDFANSTLFEMHSAAFQAGNHQHNDSGAFSLYYKAPLLLDSGIYDSYGTSHFYNYYQRTIAHNSVIIYDPAERYSVYGKTYSNEGGQKGMEFLPTVPDAMPGGKAARKGVTRYEHREAWTYIQADVSDAYDASKIEPNRGAVRSYLWLPTGPGLKHPALLLHDEIHKTSAKAGLTTRVLFHTADEPAPLGGEHVRTCHWKAAENHFVISNEGGVVELETLWPQNATVHKVGGFDGADDCRFLAWDIAGKETNYPPWTTKDPHFTPGDLVNYRDIGSWRLEVMSAEPAKDEQFLHFMAVRDESDSVPRATAVTVTGGVGAALGPVAYVFATSADHVSVDLSTLSSSWVFGLSPGGKYELTYDAAQAHVTLNPNGMATASDQGVLLVPSNPCLSGAAELLVTPTEVTITPGQIQNFTVSARDCAGAPVEVVPTWSADPSAGSIDQSGAFTAGTQTGAFSQAVRATVGSMEATASVTVVEQPALEKVRGVCHCQTFPLGVPGGALLWWLVTRRRQKSPKA